MIPSSMNTPVRHHATPRSIPPGLTRVAFTGRFVTTTRRDLAELVRGLGGAVAGSVSGRTTMLVVGLGGWPLHADGAISNKLKRAEAIRDQGGRIEILSEDQFFERIGLRKARTGSEGRGRQFTAEQCSETLGLPARIIRRWEALGLVRSDDGRYDFQDLVSLQAIAELTERGVAPADIAGTIRQLSSVLPDIERPLAQLRLVREAGMLVAEHGAARIAPDGQFMLDYEAPAPQIDTAATIRFDEPSNADEWFARGVDREALEDVDAAIAAYESALTARPAFPEAYFNLGNCLRTAGDAAGAAKQFRRAVELDPTLAAAWYNLADIEEEADDLEQAAQSLRAAIAAAPDFADAHFNLASCLDRLGRREEASGHWRRYLALDPDSRWADAARRRLQG